MRHRKYTEQKKPLLNVEKKVRFKILTESNWSFWSVFLVGLFIASIVSFVVIWSVTGSLIQSNQNELDLLDNMMPEPPTKKTVGDSINVVDSITMNNVEFRHIAPTPSINVDPGGVTDIRISLPIVPDLVVGVYGSNDEKVTVIVNEKGMIQNISTTIIGGIESIEGVSGQDIILIGGNNMEVIPGTNSVEIRVIDMPNITSVDIVNSITFNGAVSCIAPVQSSCLDVSGQSCASPISANCLPSSAIFTSIHANNLTVLNLISIRVSNQTDLTVENLQSGETTFVGPVTCSGSSMFDSNCVDFSGYTCTMGSLDSSCIPPVISFDDVGVTNTLTLGNNLVCNNPPLDSSCVKLDGYTCSTSPFTESCMPSRVETINGESGFNIVIQGGPLIDVIEQPPVDVTNTIAGTNWMLSSTIADTVSTENEFFGSRNHIKEGTFIFSGRGWFGGGREGVITPNELPEILQIDLGSIQSVGYIRALGWNGNTGIDYGTRNYRIFVSPDDITYDIIGNGEIAENDVTTWYAHAFVNRPVRYIYFYCDSHWSRPCALTEVEAYTLITSGGSSGISIKTTAELNTAEPSCNNVRPITQTRIFPGTLVGNYGGIGEMDIHTPIIMPSTTNLGFGGYGRGGSVPPTIMAGQKVDMRIETFHSVFRIKAVNTNMGFVFNYFFGDQSNPNADYLLYAYRDNTAGDGGTKIYRIQGAQVYGPGGEVDAVWGEPLINGTFVPFMFERTYSMRVEYICGRLKFYMDGVLDIDFPYEFPNREIWVGHLGFGGSYHFDGGNRHQKWSSFAPIVKQKIGSDFEFFNVDSTELNMTVVDDDNIVFAFKEQEDVSVVGTHIYQVIDIEATGFVSKVSLLSEGFTNFMNVGTMGAGPFIQLNVASYEFYNVAPGPRDSIITALEVGGNNIIVDLSNSVTPGTYTSPEHIVNEGGKITTISDGFLDTGGGTFFAYGYVIISSTNTILTVSLNLNSRCLISGPTPALYDTCNNAGYWDFTTFTIPESGIYEINVIMKRSNVNAEVRLNGVGINTVRSDNLDAERIFIIKEFVKDDNITTFIGGVSTTDTRIMWSITSFF